MLRVEGAFLMTRLGVIPFAAVGKTGLLKRSCSRKPSESCCQYPQTPTEKQGFGFQTKNPPARNRRCFWIASPALMTAPAGGAGFLVLGGFYKAVSTPKSRDGGKLVGAQT